MPFCQNTFENRSHTLFGKGLLFLMVGLILLYGLPAYSITPQLPSSPSPAGQQTQKLETPKTPATGVENQEVPEPIPLNDIAKQLEASKRELNQISKRPDDLELADIAREVEATRSSFVEETKNADTVISGSLRPEELWDIEKSWKSRSAKISRWQKKVSSYTAKLYNDLMLLEQSEKTWEVTLRHYSPQALPREVEGMIRNILAEIRIVKAHTRKQLDAALVLQSHVYQRETSVSSILGKITIAREQFRESLVVPEQVPLWKAITELEETKPSAVRLGTSLSQQLSDSLEFALTHFHKLVLTSVFFIILLIAISVLSKRVLRLTEHSPDFDEATHFLKHPHMVALLITLVGFILMFTRVAPRLLVSATGLLLLIPFLRLLPPLIHPEVRPLLYILGGFYVFDNIRKLLIVIPLLERLSFIFSNIAAIMILLWFFRPARFGKPSSHKRIPVSLIIASRVVLVLLSLSFLANIIGYFDLAKILSNGTLQSAYAAFVLFGTARAISVIFSSFLDTGFAKSLSLFRLYRGTISKWGSRLFTLVALMLWIRVVLSVFTLRDAVVGALRTFLTTPISEGGISFSVWDMLAFILVLAAAIIISRLVRLILREDVFPRIPLARGVPTMITTTIYYSLLFLGFLFALGIAGVDINKFTVLAGALGVGVGFGLQNIVNNFISGLILLFERPIHPGDVVEIGGLLGVVSRIGIRSSTIATYDGADVIVPNGMLISDKLINWTLSDQRRRVDLTVGIAYGTDPERVIDILRVVLASHRDVLQEPAPDVLFKGFGESSLDFELRFWANFQNHLGVKSKIAVAVAQSLREAGIEIPFPQRDLHLKTINPSAVSSILRNSPVAHDPPDELEGKP